MQSTNRRSGPRPTGPPSRCPTGNGWVWSIPGNPRALGTHLPELDSNGFILANLNGSLYKEKPSPSLSSAGGRAFLVGHFFAGVRCPSSQQVVTTQCQAGCLASRLSLSQSWSLESGASLPHGGQGPGGEQGWVPRGLSSPRAQPSGAPPGPCLWGHQSCWSKATH